MGDEKDAVPEAGQGQAQPPMTQERFKMMQAMYSVEIMRRRAVIAQQNADIARLELGLNEAAYDLIKAGE
jgi:hypothetical protein